MTTRRKSLLCIAIALATAAGGVAAQSIWPERPVRLIVPFAAGSFPDIVARVVADKMAVGLKQPVVVDNRAGAGGNIGTEAVVKATPDGYTLLLHTVANATSKALYRNLSFDPLKDLKPITQLASVGNVLVVHPSTPANSLKELLELSAKRQGLSYASGGNGTTSHLAVELLALQTGAKLTHVPYKNFGQALTDVMGGQPDFVMPNLPPTVESIKAGKFKPIAVTSSRRSPLLPNVPTLAESGVANYQVSSWNGLAAPAGTPDAIIRRIHAEAVKALNDPAVKERLSAQGAELAGTTPAEYEAFVRAETEKWTRLVEQAGIKLD
jgi:tripartite-type tricarboxylate transporter receptor subunit TctC